MLYCGAPLRKHFLMSPSTYAGSRLLKWLDLPDESQHLPDWDADDGTQDTGGCPQQRQREHILVVSHIVRGTVSDNIGEVLVTHNKDIDACEHHHANDPGMNAHGGAHRDENHAQNRNRGHPGAEHEPHTVYGKAQDNSEQIGIASKRHYHWPKDAAKPLVDPVSAQYGAEVQNAAVEDHKLPVHLAAEGSIADAAGDKIGGHGHHGH